ncbi:MAG TPA: glycogen/starch synthase, partial [Spirochaetota bacterium]|nr:glycogen/starch synthase [Spirochaetota bacterium]
MQKKLNVLMCASECRGVAKAGGLGDVVFDLSNGLKKAGVDTKIIIPYYEVINLQADFIEEFKVEFGNLNYKFGLYKTKINNIEIYLIKNRVFFAGETGGIY